MGPMMYLVYRSEDGWAWRYPNGQTPGQLSHRGEWVESVCSPKDFYIPNEIELYDVLEPGFTVTIEEMDE